MATTTYYAADPTLVLGGVDRSGVSHPLLKPNAKGEITVKDDEGETYDETIRAGLGAGLITLTPPKKMKE
jgi:hypothetical protein